jgi:RND family efflux transporter MFP subunit
MKRLAAAFFILVSLSLCGCREEAQESIALSRQKVALVQVKEQTMSQELQSFGTLSFRMKTDITTLVDGTLAELLVTEGSRVEPGQLLARLKNIQLEMGRSQAQEAVSSARAALELAQARLWEGELAVEARIVTVQKAELELAHKRFELEEQAKTLKNKEQLFQVGGTTEETMAALRLGYETEKISLQMLEMDLAIRKIGLRPEDILSSGLAIPAEPAERTRLLTQINTRTLSAELAAARSRLQSAETELRSAEQLMSELELRSPIRGIVGAKYVEAGERAAANTKAFTIISTSDLFAVFPLPEADALLVSVGTAVEATIEAVSSKPFKGKVELISPMIDPQAGTVTVKASIPNPGRRLMPGMFVRVKLVYGTPKRTVLLPVSCIVQKKGSKALVFAVVNSRAFLKEVTLGREMDGSYTVEAGLRNGDMLIDSPPPILKEGEEVDAQM